jgi:N-acetylglucosamine-6-phosphate deacetylase
VTLSAGFVDLQVNGIGAVDVAAADAESWPTLDARLVASGVTAWCPTLVTSPLDAYAAPLGRIAAAARRPGPVPAVLGAHLEGPFIGGAPGAHRRQHIVPLDLDWLRSLPDVVRIITLAPEVPGAVEAVRALVSRRVTVALGHSTAAHEEAVAAADAGAGLVTHCFNGMGALDHRRPGLVGAALSDDRLAVSLIADLVHVHPAVLAMAMRAKGPGRAVLVTDAVAWEAPAVQQHGVVFDGQAPRLPDGTLAGSALTMDRAVANVVRHAGVALVDALRAASTVPAAVVGASDHGRIAAGCRADLVALDSDLAVVGTWIGGEQVYGERGVVE